MTHVHGEHTREGAGRSSPETISCNLGQGYPELSCGSPFATTDSELKKWPCVPAEDENIHAHDHDYRDYGGGFAGEECADQLAMKKGPWTAEEDEKLRKCVEEHGVGNWVTIEKCSGLGRTSKSCRLRWINHLRPNLKKGCFTPEEERLLVILHKIHGNKWSYIASKLPGRTDNEVKNFWHGRVRRCHKKFLPIYPESIEDDQFCTSGLDIDAVVNSDSTLLPSITSEHTLGHDVPFEGQPNSMDKQNPSSTSETQLFSPHQRPLSSPHAQSSSNLPSPTCCYTAQMPASSSLMDVASPHGYPSFQGFRSTETSDKPPQNPLKSFQECCLLSPKQSCSKTGVTFTSLRPPPVLSSLVGKFRRSQRTCSPLSSPRTVTQFSAAEQGSPVSASGSSITYSKMNVTSPISPNTPLLYSSKLHVSVEPPAASFEQLRTLSPPSDICSSNLNPRSLNMSSMQPESCLQKNQPAAAPSLVFPLGWDSFISEPPSIQTPTSAYRPIPEMKINQVETDVVVLDAPTQEAKGEADTLCLRSVEKQYVDGCLSLPNDPVGKMLENVSRESSRQGGFFSENKRRSNELDPSGKLEHAEMKLSNTHDLVNQRLCRKFSGSKCFKPEALMGKVSRREGLLSEISKTGVLLVERGKKETILQGLLDKSSTQTQGSLTGKRSKTEDMEFGDISKRGKFVGKNFKDSKSGMCNGNNSVDKFSSLRNPNQDEVPFNISSTRSVSLNLQKQTSDQGSFREVSCTISRGNEILATRGQEHKYKTFDPQFGHGTEMAVIEDNLMYSAPTQGVLNESLREECLYTLEGESLTHQAQTVHDKGEDLLGGLLTSQEQQEILDESVWDPLSWISPADIWSPVQPCVDNFFGADAREEFSFGESLKNEVSPDNGSRERPPLESSSQRTMTLDELHTNHFVSSTSEGTAAHLSTARIQCIEAVFGQYKEEQNTKQETGEACYTLPEDFSDILDIAPTSLPDWYDDMDYEASSISDMVFGFEMSYHNNDLINEVEYR